MEKATASPSLTGARTIFPAKASSAISRTRLYMLPGPASDTLKGVQSFPWGTYPISLRRSRCVPGKHMKGPFRGVRSTRGIYMVIRRGFFFVDFVPLHTSLCGSWLSEPGSTTTTASSMSIPFSPRIDFRNTSKSLTTSFRTLNITVLVEGLAPVNGTASMPLLSSIPLSLFLKASRHITNDVSENGSFILLMLSRIECCT
mmetsp:Transcript_1334/g.2385  ORF Transcript_1334/g.2385 Transcript_1334/m.2385 type:complete len:201 (-) Transcript_1334:650-1252(-)